MGIRNDIVCHATSAIGVAIFRHTTLEIRGVFIFRSTTTMRGEHNNQPKEGGAAKMPAKEAKQQATTSGATKGQEGGTTQMPAQRQQWGQWHWR
jgi:hypothetical protein